MDINAEIEKLLREIGPGRMSSTAYDTSWVARLGEIDRELSTNALSWLCEHQLPDGSWGAAEPFYYHDRVISTLAAMIALTYQGRRAQDKVQIERGLLALENITGGATIGLAADPNGATVGFEMIVPALVEEAEKSGVIKQQGDRILGRLGRLREAKMAKLAGLKINRYISAAFSAEMAGKDKQYLLDIDNLQEANGSVGNSPSATAYFALQVKPGDQKALAYLHSSIVTGGAPFATPFNVFERAWILWNIAFFGSPADHKTSALCQPHLDFLQSAWKKGRGVGFAAEYSPCDGDDTSMTFDALVHFERKPDVAAIMSYEESAYFRCYAIEANLHILGALRRAGFDSRQPAVKKIITFLHQSRQRGGFWLDKWHTSPYYITAHAIIALHGYDNNLCRQSIEWIIKTQKADGAWGFYGSSTAEETAYCIQALKTWQRAGGKIPSGRIDHAVRWLEQNAEPPYPPMWISKALYCPELVVRSTILSALAFAKGS
jgi:halimadienyl-diphosphate synthase